jgi:hypothetical protein
MRIVVDLPAPCRASACRESRTGAASGASDSPRGRLGRGSELLTFGGGQRREELAVLLVEDPHGCRLGALAADVYKGLKAIGLAAMFWRVTARAEACPSQSQDSRGT